MGNVVAFLVMCWWLGSTAGAMWRRVPPRSKTARRRSRMEELDQRIRRRPHDLSLNKFRR
jgi:hypothetical protein